MYFKNVERDVLNFNLIVEQCGLNNYPEADVIKKISSLESEYNASELVSIFNYLLMNTENVEVLIHIIKLTDLKRNPATLAILLEKLQSISYTDNDELINLKELDKIGVVPYLQECSDSMVALSNLEFLGRYAILDISFPS